MAENNQEVQEKRKYVKSGNPRSTLWQDICKEHGIKNYRKDSPDYQRARELYEKALELKKKRTPTTTTSNIDSISTPKASLDVTYLEELPESKSDQEANQQFQPNAKENQEAKQLVQPKVTAISTDTWSKRVQKSIPTKQKHNQ